MVNYTFLSDILALFGSQTDSLPETTSTPQSSLLAFTQIPTGIASLLQRIGHEGTGI